jgi:hypothetical protein
MSAFAELAQQFLESAEYFERLNMPEARLVAQTCRVTARMLAEDVPHHSACRPSGSLQGSSHQTG